MKCYTLSIAGLSEGIEFSSTLFERYTTIGEKILFFDRKNPAECVDNIVFDATLIPAAIGINAHANQTQFLLSRNSAESELRGEALLLIDTGTTSTARQHGMIHRLSGNPKEVCEFGTTSPDGTKSGVFVLKPGDILRVFFKGMPSTTAEIVRATSHGEVSIHGPVPFLMNWHSLPTYKFKLPRY